MHVVHVANQRDLRGGQVAPVGAIVIGAISVAAHAKVGDPIAPGSLAGQIDHVLVHAPTEVVGANRAAPWSDAHPAAVVGRAGKGGNARAAKGNRAALIHVENERIRRVADLKVCVLAIAVLVEIDADAIVSDQVDVAADIVGIGKDPPVVSKGSSGIAAQNDVCPGIQTPAPLAESLRP